MVIKKQIDWYTLQNHIDSYSLWFNESGTEKMSALLDDLNSIIYIIKFCSVVYPVTLLDLPQIQYQVYFISKLMFGKCC